MGENDDQIKLSVNRSSPDIDSKVSMSKAPWKPSVSGSIAFFFGPVASGIITYINLKRLDHPKKANLVLKFTFIGTVILILLLFMMSEFMTNFMGTFIGHFLTIFLFIKLQKKEFKDWQINNEHIKPSNGWRTVGWGFLGFFLYLVIAFILAFIVPDDFIR